MDLTLVPALISFIRFEKKDGIMRKRISISVYLGYFVSLVTCSLGIILVSGLAFLNVPPQMRVMFGVVMILLGVYRFVLTQTKMRQQQEEKDSEE